jgi:hypothetical protein
MQKGGVTFSPSIRAAAALTIQMVVGIFLFGVLAIAGVLLNLAIKFCQHGELAPQWAIYGMYGLEMFLWGADALCLVLFVLKEVGDFCVKLTSDSEGKDGKTE